MLRMLTGLLAGLALTAGAAAQQPGMPMGMGGMPGMPGFGQASQGSTARAGLSAGAAVYLLGTYADEAGAFITTTDPGSANPTEAITPFPVKFQAAPAVWLGWTFGSGVGIRGRYFTRLESPGPRRIEPAAGVEIQPPPSARFPEGFPTATLNLAPTFTSPGVLAGAGFGADILTFSRTMSLHATDVEVTFQQGLGGVNLIASLGGRYLRMSQGSISQLLNEVVLGVLDEQQTLVYVRRFTGGGPTAALELSLPLAGSLLAGFVGTRLSAVAGNREDSLTFTQEVRDFGGVVGGPATGSNSRVQYGAQIIPISEFEVGLELNGAWSGRPMVLRGAAVSQTYFNAGSSTGRGGNLTLFGAMVSVGISF